MNTSTTFVGTCHRRLNRLTVLCAAVLTLSTGLTCAASTAEEQNLFRSPVYVTLQASGAVENMQTAKTSSVPDAHYVAVSSDGKLLLVSSAGTSNVYLLDAHNGKTLANFNIGPVAQGVAISPDGHWGLAVSAGNGTVTVIDIRTQQKVKTIAVGETPHNARFTSNSKRAYVTLQGVGSVAVLDMEALEKIDEFPVPGIKHPHNLDLSTNEKILWIRDFLGKVAAVDLTSHKVLAVIPVGQGHAGIDVIPSGQYVFTGGTADHVVDVIDANTLTVIQRIDVGQGPHGVRASRNGHWIYVGVTDTNKVAVIDTRTLEVVAQIPTHGTLPFWFAVAGNP